MKRERSKSRDDPDRLIKREKREESQPRNKPVKPDSPENKVKEEQVEPKDQRAVHPHGLTPKYKPGHLRPAYAKKSMPPQVPPPPKTWKPEPVPVKDGSSRDRWGEVKKEVKKEIESDEDEFYDAEEYFGSSWLTNDCPTLPGALEPYIREVSTNMEDFVILEEDHTRPEAHRFGLSTK